MTQKKLTAKKPSGIFDAFSKISFNSCTIYFSGTFRIKFHSYIDNTLNKNSKVVFHNSLLSLKKNFNFCNQKPKLAKFFPKFSTKYTD